jgi:hypothetical protein
MQSDHAGVVVTTKHYQKVRRWNKCVKLENDVVINNDTLIKLREEMVAQLETARGLTLHMVLEFAKCHLRKLD